MPSLYILISTVGILTLLYLFHSRDGWSQPVARGPRDSRDAGTPSANMAMARPKWSEDIDIVYDEPERLRRISYGSGPGATVHGYPAKGGIYVLDKASGVEVEFLGFDRLSTETSSDANTEEAHCDNMRRLGAVWWKSQYDYHLSCVPGLSTWPEAPQKYIRVGWPAAGGVWVLNTTTSAVACKGAGILYNAYTMEERCKVIERLGGTFYDNPKDCPDLDLP